MARPLRVARFRCSSLGETDCVNLLNARPARFDFSRTLERGGSLLLGQSVSVASQNELAARALRLDPDYRENQAEHNVRGAVKILLLTRIPAHASGIRRAQPKAAALRNKKRLMQRDDVMVSDARRR